ncbi:hypothetical protein tloyanaT_32120 [Thalassotalea loyana]|uniref:Phage abortive infection protein n=1 Tax=Thalassotalea loyana TaxID=280483 RepID=A0ABQ6HHJ7_9GAMM|nr:putative phage abortive infection protein [Thalassotalea loyana]GLX86959.1 hypothetical protein tloyanaT_32120 [Thalassotalea loyana]
MKNIKKKWNEINDSAFRKFDGFFDLTSESLTKSLFKLVQYAVYLSFIVILVNTIFNRKNDGGFSWGEYGDFMGGVLNPILSFLAFTGVLITIVIQHRELKESRKQFERSANALDKQSESMDIQNFETTLFSLIDLHNEIVKQQHIIPEGNSNGLSGKSCFKYYYLEFVKHHINIEHIVKEFPNKELIEYSYLTFGGAIKTQAEQYFINLYSILRFIYQSEKVNSEHYFKLFKAQLSRYELALIFYDGLVSNSSEKKELIEVSKLFENLDRSILANSITHPSLYNASAFALSEYESITSYNEMGENIRPSCDIKVYLSFEQVIEDIDNLNVRKVIVLSKSELCRYIVWDFIDEEEDFNNFVQDIVGARRKDKDKWRKEHSDFISAMNRGVFYFNFSDSYFGEFITSSVSGFNYSMDEWLSKVLPKIINVVNSTESVELYNEDNHGNVKIAAIESGIDFNRLYQEYKIFSKAMELINVKLKNTPSEIQYNINSQEFHLEEK